METRRFHVAQKRTHIFLDICLKYDHSESINHYYVQCPSHCTWTGFLYLYGTDYYYSSSYVCAAAVHAGIISSK